VRDPSFPADGACGAWMRAAALDDLWEDEMARVRLAEADVLVVRLSGGEIHAYDNRCPHAGSPLSEGTLHATTLRCDAHFWEFDARTGHGINPRNCRLRRYPVKIVNGDVMVWVASPC
jgi:toluene monooxygenase system ferredoxin subunit